VLLPDYKMVVFRLVIWFPDLVTLLDFIRFVTMLSMNSVFR